VAWEKGHSTNGGELLNFEENFTSEGLVAMTKEHSVFLEVMLFSLSQVYLHSGGKYCLCLRGWKVNQAHNQQEASLDPEDGSSTFLKNRGNLPVDYTASHTRR
jgi:hypothetical protein